MLYKKGISLSKKGITYKKVIVWTNSNHQPIGDGGPNDNPTTGGPTGFNPGGGGTGYGPGFPGNTGGMPGGFIPGGNITQAYLQEVEKVAGPVEDGQINTIYVKLRPVVSVQPFPGSMFHWMRTVWFRTDYQGTNAEQITVNTDWVGVNQGGDLIYDSTHQNNHIGGDLTDGAIHPQLNLPFNNWDEGQGGWQSSGYQKDIWVKSERENATQWLAFMAYACSEPFTSLDTDQQLFYHRVLFDTAFADAAVPMDTDDPGGRGNTVSEDGELIVRDNQADNLLIFTPPVEKPPMIYEYSSPELTIAQTIDEKHVSPTNTLFINLTGDDNVFDLAFQPIQLELNPDDITANYDTEFSEIEPVDVEIPEGE